MKQGIVQLEVLPEGQKEQSGTISEVYFFPEQKDVIDSTIEPTVAASKVSNRYLVNLKGSDEIGAGSKTLKGVLVFHQQNGSQELIQAIDMDSPIEDEGDEEFLSIYLLHIRQSAKHLLRTQILQPI